MEQGNGDKMFFGPTAWFDLQEFENSWIGLAEIARERNQYVGEYLDNEINNNNY